ncbi:MAG: hypothetical protein PHQ59_01765 [Candidatus Daviesbacteria bacterium]|nr:hypothetical protein [Candidatus Daviesbacteria bacterium]
MADHKKKAQEIVARAYNLSDAFEETVEELFNYLDSVKEKRRKQFGEDSEPYKTSVQYVAMCREILKKIQTNHAEGFDLLLEFVKDHIEKEQLEDSPST